MAGLRPSYLVDKSAYARMSHPPVEEALTALIQSGAVATCGILQLELLFSARGETEFRSLRQDMEQRFALVYTEQADFDRATNVMQSMSVGGRHRSVAIPDLLVAAVAERNGLEVIHYDQDFDRIANVTGQPVRWVVPRGSM